MRNRHRREAHTRKRPFQLHRQHHNNISENLVCEALTNLVRKKALDFFIHAEHCDALDAAHIDFVLARKRKVIALQIKGHSDGAIRHKERWPLIPCLVVSRAFRREDIEVLQEALLNIFYKEHSSHEHVLDERTVRIIEERVRAEGYLDLSPFM